jgi:hypothetical protein
MFKDCVISNITNFQKDKDKIQSVSEYLEIIKKITVQKSAPNRLFVYRGEAEKYIEFCTPNIFRKNVLSSNDFYEKSLFNSMRQNKLTHSSSYLENAIDAQHGEFPSRLLDVSYNCLVALYFAVTPYYHQQVDSLDTVDGMVYIFYIDEIFSPSAANINDNYNAIINKGTDWFNKQAIFEKNHKFIDHTKINNRLVAQQGAFILFQGEDAEKIPPYMMNGIVIPSSSKAKIRKELSDMFGINTGYIYPEIVNLSNEIAQKSKMLITEDFNWKNEMSYAIKNLENELDYFREYMIVHDKEKYKATYYDAIQFIEATINSYRTGIIKFCGDFLKLNDGESKRKNDVENTIKGFIDNYNYLVNNFRDDMIALYNTQISLELNIN